MVSGPCGAQASGLGGDGRRGRGLVSALVGFFSARESGDQMIDAGEELFLQPPQLGRVHVGLVVGVRDGGGARRSGAGHDGSMGFAARPDGGAVEGRAGRSAGPTPGV